MPRYLSHAQPWGVTQRSNPLRSLEGPGSAQRLHGLQRRFQRAPSSRGWLSRIGRRLLVVYWAACLAVIALGLDRLYPYARPALAARVASALPAPAPPAAGGADLQAPPPRNEPALSNGATRPFRSCAAAHAAGVYDIPAGSSAYSPQQDGDGDGLACEPY